MPTRPSGRWECPCAPRPAAPEKCGPTAPAKGLFLVSEALLAALREHADPANVAGMARYGIGTVGTLGVPMPVLRRLAKEAGRDHALAEALWNSGIHEARILATLVDIPTRV